MGLPLHIAITSVAVATDGGTVFLGATDECGRAHTIRLVQHVSPRFDSSQSELADRLYFDGELITIRSADEAAILGLLNEAHAQETDELTRSFVARITAFVESEEYLLFADRLTRAAEQAADKTRYTVWIAHDTESRNRVIVRLGQVDGLSLRQARELIDQQRPLAENIPASEVPSVAARYLTAGLGVRVEPPFRWQLS